MPTHFPKVLCVSASDMIWLRFENLSFGLLTSLLPTGHLPSFALQLQLPGFLPTSPLPRDFLLQRAPCLPCPPSSFLLCCWTVQITCVPRFLVHLPLSWPYASSLIWIWAGMLASAFFLSLWFSHSYRSLIFLGIWFLLWMLSADGIWVRKGSFL